MASKAREISWHPSSCPNAILPCHVARENQWTLFMAKDQHSKQLRTEASSHLRHNPFLWLNRSDRRPVKGGFFTLVGSRSTEASCVKRYLSPNCLQLRYWATDASSLAWHTPFCASGAFYLQLTSLSDPVAAFSDTSARSSQQHWNFASCWRRWTYSCKWWSLLPHMSCFLQQKPCNEPWESCQYEKWECHALAVAPTAWSLLVSTTWEWTLHLTWETWYKQLDLCKTVLHFLSLNGAPTTTKKVPITTLSISQDVEPSHSVTMKILNCLIRRRLWGRDVVMKIRNPD